MIRSLGTAWFLSAALAAVAAVAAAWLVAAGEAEPAVVATLGIAFAACVLALAAAPLALAPGEALRASLGRGEVRWGTGRGDLWGELAREIARAMEPVAPLPDPFLEMRRIAADLEVTLHQTGEDLAVARASVGEATRGILSAAEAGERLAAAAGEAERRLAGVSTRSAAAEAALVAFPERIGAIDAASDRAIAAAAAIVEAAEAAVRLRAPSAEEEALRAAVARGAEQARRLEAAMPLLVEAIDRLPAAAASEARLSGIVEALSGVAATFGDSLVRLDGLAQRVEEAATSLAPHDIAPAISAAIARIDAAREGLVAAGLGAFDQAVTRLCDIAEVTALDAAWRAGERAEAAVARIEAAAAAEREESAARIASLSEAQRDAEGALQRRAAETLARIEAALAGHRVALDGLVVRLDAVGAALAHSVADDSVLTRAAALLGEAEGLVRRLEDSVAALARANAAITVDGDAPIPSVAARLLAQLSDMDDPVPPARPLGEAQGQPTSAAIPDAA